MEEDNDHSHNNHQQKQHHWNHHHDRNRDHDGDDGGNYCQYHHCSHVHHYLSSYGDADLMQMQMIVVVLRPIMMMRRM